MFLRPVNQENYPLVDYPLVNYPLVNYPLVLATRCMRRLFPMCSTKTLPNMVLLALAALNVTKYFLLIRDLFYCARLKALNAF